MINNSNRVFSNVRRKARRSSPRPKVYTGERARTLDQRSVPSKALVTVSKTLYDQAVKQRFFERLKEYGRK